MVDSREAEEGAAVRRRRECLNCHSRFSTVERLTGPSPLWVVKRSGAREVFTLEKVVAGVTAACKNRPVSAAQVEELAHDVEESMRSGGGAVTSERVGTAVLDRLRQLDEVAYLRFASVYKGFDSAGDFAREAGLLPAQPDPARRPASSTPRPAPAVPPAPAAPPGS